MSYLNSRLARLSRISQDPSRSKIDHRIDNATFATISHQSLWFNPKSGEYGIVAESRPSSWIGVVVATSLFYRVVDGKLQRINDPGPNPKPAGPGYTKILTITGDVIVANVVGMTMRLLPARDAEGKIVYILDN